MGSREVYYTQLCLGEITAVVMPVVVTCSGSDSNSSSEGENSLSNSFTHSFTHSKVFQFLNDNCGDRIDNYWERIKQDLESQVPSAVMNKCDSELQKRR